MPHTKINGASLYHQFDGPADAPVVLLCNSLGTNLHMWDAQMPALSKTYRMLRYDSRGHGQSDVTPGPYTIEMLGKDAIGLLDALDIRRVLFCGLSLGGVIAQWLGIHGRDRLNAIVISNSAAKIGNDDFWNKRIEKLRYIHRNPVKRGLVERPEDWLWSSFRHYISGVEGTVEIESQWTARKRERMGVEPLMIRQSQSPHPVAQNATRVGHPQK